MISTLETNRKVVKNADRAKTTHRKFVTELKFDNRSQLAKSLIDHLGMDTTLLEVGLFFTNGVTKERRKEFYANTNRLIRHIKNGKFVVADFIAKLEKDKKLKEESVLSKTVSEEEDPFIIIKILPVYAKSLYSLLEEDYPKTKEAINSNIAKRDFNVHRAIETHLDMTATVMGSLEKSLGITRKKCQL